MNAEKSYRDALIDALIVIEDNYQRLMVLGMELVMYEDKRNGLVPFEDGDEIPVYVDVFESSDIPAVRTVGQAILLIREISFSLRNINKFSNEEIADRQPLADCFSEPEHEMSTDQDITFEEFKSGIYVSFSDIMFFCNSSAYWMIYGKDGGEELHDTFFFPTEETYALLSSKDSNVKLLVDLSRYLEGHRDRVWED